MCAARKARFFCPAREFLVDNGAMIAYTGELMFRKKVYLAYSELDIKPRERTDEVKVVWR
jgi:tRNA A37 threonylcarbamoyltransferase TsaD